MPDELYPTPLPSATQPSSPSPTPYKISLLVHPSPIRVSYNTVSLSFPTLLDQYNPNFILHIGMAGGRDCYSLETRAHRDGYRIKDVDDSDGFSCGESVWKNLGVPDVLFVGWDEEEVLRRWEKGVEVGLKERGFLGRVSRTELESEREKGATAKGVGVGLSLHMSAMWGTSSFGSPTSLRAEENRKKSVVKLSRDAGRFLCEYALFESLSLRWRDAQKRETSENPPSSSSPPSPSSRSSRRCPSNSSDPRSSASTEDPSQTTSESGKDIAASRVGAVAFLHVPGWTGVEDINRGVMVAEEAIRALVGSWEDGFRRETMGRRIAGARAFTTQHSETAETRIEGKNPSVAVGAIGAPMGSGRGMAWRA